MMHKEQIRQAEVMVKAAGREVNAQNLLSTTLTYYPELRYTVGMPEILDYLSPPKYATGGIVKAPHLAIMGNGHHANMIPMPSKGIESVIPAKRGEKVEININPKDIKKSDLKAIRKLMKPTVTKKTKKKGAKK